MEDIYRCWKGSKDKCASGLVNEFIKEWVKERWKNKFEKTTKSEDENVLAVF